MEGDAAIRAGAAAFIAERNKEMMEGHANIMSGFFERLKQAGEWLRTPLLKEPAPAPALPIIGVPPATEPSVMPAFDTKEFDYLNEKTDTAKEKLKELGATTTTPSINDSALDVLIKKIATAKRELASLGSSIISAAEDTAAALQAGGTVDRQFRARLSDGGT
jgi:hypothetical protein